jgi:hypothetical protein
MSRVGDAGLDTAPVPEALARLTRAVIGAVSRWRGLEIFHKIPGESEKVQRELVSPVVTLFERGAAEGAFRTDMAVATLIEIYVALLEGAVSRVIRHRMRVEEASTAVTTIFLNGVTVEPASR